MKLNKSCLRKVGEKLGVVTGLSSTRTMTGVHCDLCYPHQYDCPLSVPAAIQRNATFGTIPNEPYDQMFSILGGLSRPCYTTGDCFDDENRTTGHYRQVLQRIKRSVRRQTGHDWEPLTAVVMDFEQALVSAVETELPTTSIWRGVTSISTNQEVASYSRPRLARGYRHDERLQQLLRKVMSRGFLPTALESETTSSCYAMHAKLEDS